MASAPEPEEKGVTLCHYPIVVPCDLCEEIDDVNSFCRNCSQNLCDGCKRLHLRSTVSRDHNMVHISEGKSSDSEATFCTEHGDRLFFYCRTCSTLFCQKCLNPSHKTHDFLDTDEYAKELQSKVASMIEEKSIKVEESRKNVLHIEESKKKYADTYTKYKRSIMDTADSLRHEVDKVEAELLSTLSNHEAQGLAKLDKAKAQEKTTGDKLQESLDKLVRHSKKHDNISLVAYAYKMIGDFQNSIQTIHSSCVPVVEFKALQISKDAVSKLFGSLQYSDVEFSMKYAESSTQSQRSQTKQHSSRDINRQKDVPQPVQSNKYELCSCLKGGMKGSYFVSEKMKNKCKLCKKPIANRLNINAS